MGLRALVTRSAVGGSAAVLFVLLLATVLASTPLLTGGWIVGHDSYAHFTRVVATCHEMLQGDFYPRWLSIALYGKGLPDLEFYSPAFYLAASLPIVLFGVSLTFALKSTCFFASFLGACGVYCWVRRHSDSAGALLSATLFLFAPYRFLDLYVRCALPEHCALSLLPWLFFSIDSAFCGDDSFRRALPVGLASAAIVLTHHLSAVMIVPFALVYAAWSYANADRRPSLVVLASGPLLGAGLSAFYWLPMLCEMKYLSLVRTATSVSEHFVYPSQWFLPGWGFGVSKAGLDDGLSFQVGLVLLFCTAAALLALRTVAQEARKFGRLALGLAVMALWLTSSYASAIYDFIPPLNLIQFPWRFLGPAALFLSALAGVATGAPLLRNGRWLLLAAVLAFSVLLSKEQRSVASRVSFGSLSAPELAVILRVRDGCFMATDFLPEWAHYDPNGRVEQVAFVEPEQGSGTFLPYEMRGEALCLTVSADRPSRVTVPVYYFPGWKARVDGSEVPTFPDAQGFVSAMVPAGGLRVEFHFGTTAPRVVGWAVFSLAALLACISLRTSPRAKPTSSGL